MTATATTDYVPPGELEAEAKDGNFRATAAATALIGAVSFMAGVGLWAYFRSGEVAGNIITEGLPTALMICGPLLAIASTIVAFTASKNSLGWIIAWVLVTASIITLGAGITIGTGTQKTKPAMTTSDTTTGPVLKTLELPKTPQ